MTVDEGRRRPLRRIAHAALDRLSSPRQGREHFPLRGSGCGSRRRTGVPRSKRLPNPRTGGARWDGPCRDASKTWGLPMNRAPTEVDDVKVIVERGTSARAALPPPLPPDRPHRRAVDRGGTAARLLGSLRDRGAQLATSCCSWPVRPSRCSSSTACSTCTTPTGTPPPRSSAGSCWRSRSGVGGILALSFWSKGEFSRTWLALSWAFATVAALATRRLWHAHIGHLKADGELSFPTLIVGHQRRGGASVHAHGASVLRVPSARHGRHQGS